MERKDAWMKLCKKMILTKAPVLQYNATWLKSIKSQVVKSPCPPHPLFKLEGKELAPFAHGRPQKQICLLIPPSRWRTGPCPFCWCRADGHSPLFSIGQLDRNRPPVCFHLTVIWPTRQMGKGCSVCFCCKRFVSKDVLVLSGTPNLCF